MPYVYEDQIFKPKQTVLPQEGLVVPGNLSPWSRPILKNDDGSISNTRSISVETDEGEVLIPTVVDGKQLSEDEAISRYQDTGEHLGIFDSTEAANSYSEALHNEQARRIFRPDEELSDLQGIAAFRGAKTNLSDVLYEQFAQSFEENPIKATMRWNQLREDFHTGPHLTKEAADAQLTQAGLAGRLTVDVNGITQNALSTLIERKNVEIRRQEIFARSPGGFLEGSARLGVGLLTMASDPVTVAASFVPVVGQARYLKWLSATKSAWGRVGVRAGTGAIEGAVGNALIEPFIYASRRYEQADYDAVNSLMNVGFGALFGASLHTGVGALADVAKAFKFEGIAEAHGDPNFEFDFPREVLTGNETPFKIVEFARYQDIPVGELDRLSNMFDEVTSKGGTTAREIDSQGNSADALRFIISALRSSGKKFAVVDQDGKIVAALSYREKDGHIHGEFLGSTSPGAGRFLMKRMLDEARAKNLNIGLTPTPKARAFYKRLGFDETQHGMQFNARNQHIERTRESVGQAVQGEPINVIRPADDEADNITRLFEELKDLNRQANETTNPDQLSDLVRGAQDIQTELENLIGVDAVEMTLREMRGRQFAETGQEPTVPMSEIVVSPDPEIRQAIEQAEEVEKEISSDPVDDLDETLANAESDLAATESRLGIEEQDRKTDLDLEEVTEAASQATRWAKAAEIAENCLLRS